jgi:translocation and assembly module TamB
MNKATHVHGKVNATVDKADIPLTGPPSRTLSMTGQIVFQDVTFAPGPLATELLTLTGQPDSPGVKIEQPVQLSIADGRVYQKGLEIPIRRDAKIALEGSVGFDQSLKMVATVPITSNMIGVRSGAIDRAIGGKTVAVPIGGTVSRPRVDERALRVALKELSGSVLNRELSEKASKFLDRLAPPPAAGDGTGAGSGLPTDAKGLEDAFRQFIKPRRSQPNPAGNP